MKLNRVLESHRGLDYPNILCLAERIKMAIFKLYPSKYVQRFFSSQATKHGEKWKSVVGLEVHAQINSKSKLFSGAPTKFSSPVNTNATLYDIAIPGTLPKLNERCVEAGILTALSLNCRINPVSYFDRKHYFYADMPAGYQITQQRAPLASEGNLEFHVFNPGKDKTPYKITAGIKQIQLEQDSGRSLHDKDRSLVDLNRAGLPLMELVFEPDLADGEEAAALIKELSLILQRLETCSCKMEEGALRIDANVSIHRANEPFGTRTEIKNIGSIRGVAGAVTYEIRRQIDIRERNGTIVNETRAWDAQKKVTVPMRDKEVQQDYRYMPEPNLPPLHVSMGPIGGGHLNVDAIKKRIPELPAQIRSRLRNNYGLTLQQSIVLVDDSGLLSLFEDALADRNIRPTKLANFLINELKTILNQHNLATENLGIRPQYLGEIVELLENSTIARGVAIPLLEELLNDNLANPLKIVERKNWRQITDKTELERLCREVLDEHEEAVRKFLKGKLRVFNAFMTAVQKKSNMRADMRQCDLIFKKLLGDMARKK